MNGGIENNYALKPKICKFDILSFKVRFISPSCCCKYNR